MKNNILFLVSLCSLVLLSCQKEDIEAPSVEDRTYTYTFAGSCGTPDTKISVGDKTEAGWPIKWTNGDVIAVFKEGVSEKLGLPKLGTDYAGKTHGVFTLDSSEQYEGNVVIAHPGSATYTAEGLLSGEVPSEQEVIRAGNSGHIGKSGLAYAKAVMSGTDVPSDFVLNHLSAYVRLVLRTEEFAGHTLTGATLWCKGTSLAGTISVNVNDGTLSTTGTGDYVKSYVRSGNEAAFGNESVLWFSTLPVDLTGKSLYVIVHMTRNDGATVTVPVEITGGNLKAGSVNSITIKDLRTSSAPAWYETVETRYIAAYGEGWSYGPANTVLAYVKGEPQTVEFKARGNFRYVTEPKYVKFQYGHDLNSGNVGGTRVDGESCHDGSSYKEFPLDENYSVDISVGYSGTYPGYMAGMYVMDADRNVIWGTNVWAVTELNEIQYENGTILDRNLGSGYKGDDNNSHAAKAVFQWGRPFAFGHSGVTIANTLACDNVTSLAVSAATPYTFYKYDGVTYVSGDKPNDWWYGNGSSDASNHINDLWGNDASSGSGVKSNYDPCPKGYRVASPGILDEVMSKASLTTTTAKCYYLSCGDATWSFSSIRWGSSGGTATLGTDRVAYWSNAASGTNAYCMVAKYDKSTGQLGTYATSNGRANAFTVRCMVDTEDR